MPCRLTGVPVWRATAPSWATARPELGLSNWENGRLFARGGVLSGDSVFTIRTRMIQADPELDRQASAPPGAGDAKALRGPALQKVHG